MPQQEQNIPALRFPEFDGAWERIKLSEHVQKVGSGVTPTGGAAVYKDHGIPLLRSQNVREGYLDLKDVAYIDEETHLGMKGSVVFPNDVLLNITGASIGRSCIAPENFGEANVNQHVCIIRVKESLEPKYLQTFLASHRGQQLIFQSQAGGGREGLNFENIRNFRMKIPEKKEQQKIAAFLGAVDEKIAQLQKKKDLLETYKKGCMQKLFSQAIRFTDDNGNPFPDWEEKTLGELYSWINTNSLSRERLTYELGRVQNIHYGDIHTRFHKNFHQSRENIPFITGAKRRDFNEDSFIRLGDVVIADASEDYADIGKAIEAVELNDTPLVAGLHTYIARPKANTLSLGFSSYLFQSSAIRSQIMRIAQGISVLGVSKGNLEKLNLLLPHPDEQKKIADFLSAIDDKIKLVSEELDKARTFKKGLLQQMFV